MKILVSKLPSGGEGYDFESVNVSPLTYLEIIKYLENVPEDPIEKYLYDIDWLKKEDKKIADCYLMDIDFLIFLKKLTTVSENQSLHWSCECPTCKRRVNKTIVLDKDIQFKQIDRKVMGGCSVILGDHAYDITPPTANNLLHMFNRYLRTKSIFDLDMIKTVSLFHRDFDISGNQIEDDVINATRSDITMLLALKDLYYDRLEKMTVYCPDCNAGKSPEERRGMTISVDSLVVDFFRDLLIHSPIDQSKIVFKQISESRRDRKLHSEFSEFDGEGVSEDFGDLRWSRS